MFNILLSRFQSWSGDQTELFTPVWYRYPPAERNKVTSRYRYHTVLLHYLQIFFASVCQCCSDSEAPYYLLWPLCKSLFLYFESQIYTDLLVPCKLQCSLTCVMRDFMSGNDVRHLFLNRPCRLPVLWLTERWRRYSLYQLQ